MGNKNHATVLLACRKVEQMIEKNNDIRWQGPAGNKISKAKKVLDKLQENISR